MVSLQLSSPDYFHSEVKINCMKKLFLFNRQVAHRDKGFFCLDAVQTRLSREEPANLRVIRRAFNNSLWLKMVSCSFCAPFCTESLFAWSAFFKICTANAVQTFAFRFQPLSLLSLGIMGAVDATWVLSLAVPEAEADNPHSKTSNCFLFLSLINLNASSLKLSSAPIGW